MRLARYERGLTQRQLAELTKMDKETINRVENGANTSTDTLAKIREALPNLIMSSEPYVNGSYAKSTRVSGRENIEVIELRQRISHLVLAVMSVKHLRRIETQVLHALVTPDRHVRKPVTRKRQTAKKRKVRR
jgi:transcriptional regulator with XRE-family HTH domain